jgi:hypothetical protein
LTIGLKGDRCDIGLLTIFLNLEKVDRELAIMIVNEIRSEFCTNENNQTNYFKVVYPEPTPEVGKHNLLDDKSLPIRGIELDENAKQIKEIKQKLKDILIRNYIADYIVTIDPGTQNNLIVLKRSELVQYALELHCRHCGMEFEDEIQLGNHLRIHYMI